MTLPRFRLVNTSLLGLLLAAGCGGGGNEVSNAPSTNVPSAVVENLPFSTPGPFATSVDGDATCTIFRPSALGGDGVTFPVILWGNGTAARPADYQGLLSHLASYGFIVTAANTANAGDGSQMLDCLAFVFAQNELASSPLFRHIDTQRVGATGHSQGGAGALMAGRDARVSVTAPVQPHILPITGGGAFDALSVREQRGPMFLLSGGLDVIAPLNINQRPVFDNANVPVVWGTLAGADHQLVFGNGSGYRGPLTAWFRFRLLGDTTAAQYFPPACTLCVAPGWSVLLK